MKKIFYYLILILLFIGIFALVARSYDPMSFKQEFRQNYNSQSKNFQKEPNTPMQKRYDNRIPEQRREYQNPTNQDSRYNSSCQFGVCVPTNDGKPTR